uniref:Uncharacterized protein n=1 Tax=Candidatus Methanophagaceae archaeon ANME-1 ERB6 TaxID=2759912 RepID=A0A7G9YY96_9EURY|nr:hypothetical protein FLHAOPAA_00010 [Methanosarcinales archaeon ANME-1 ERB6]
MTRGWGKRLLFKIAIGVVVLFALLICMQTTNASEMLGIDVTSPSAVCFTFGPSTQNTKHSSFTITNTAKNTTLKVYDILYSPPSGITITLTPPEKNFELYGDAHRNIDLRIEVDPSKALEKEHICPITIKSNAEETEKTVYLSVIIKYNAKIVVSGLPVDFGTVSSKKYKVVSEPITISEEYGYKPLESVTISPAYGNENTWVHVGSYPSQISNPVDVTFTLTPGPPDYERHDNKYTWKFIIKSSNADPVTITVKARIMRPPKLGSLHDEELEIKFDKPKGTVSKYDRYIDVPVRNLGDEPMHFSSSVSESPGGGITIRIDRSPGVVSKRGSENIKVHIIAPYDTPEGTYQGKLFIDTVEDKDGYVKITIVIKWPVDFIISSTSIYFTPSPPFIDFGTIELKEREYEKKSANITLTEFYLYKPVRNLRFSKSGEYGKWLKEETDFSEIPPGESRNITLKIEPGLEAVPKSYSWKYDISAREIGAKRIDVIAKIVPMNIPEMIEYLNSFRESILYKSYPTSEVIISNGVEMLEAVEESEIDADDWKKLPVLMKGTLSLLSSLNDGITFSEEENYGKAVENLVSASVSTSTIGSNSELNNWDISRYAKDISTGADKTTEEVLINEAKKLELRGWNIKKAVEHAMALDDISGLKKEENVLNSSLSYQHAATIYSLLNDKEKRLECVYEESLLVDKHEELVSDATALRIKAENKISNSKENDLIRIGDIYLLLNPYKYDTFSESYGSAEKYLEDALKNYKVAGVSLMSEDTEKKLKEVKSEWRYILSMFFLACILYGAAFIYTINRVIMGTVAYMRDMYEREVGDIIVK